MYTEINQQLEEARQGIHCLHKIDSMLKSLRSEEGALELKLSELKSILDREDIDVKRLEKTSLASLFYSILGSLEEHMDKEKREALAAKLKYDQGVHEMESVQHEISKLCSEQSEYRQYESKYQSLYARKKEMLMESDSGKAQDIMHIGEQIEALKDTKKEIREAVSAGRNVLSGLDKAIGSLESAEGWGVWDMFGGGVISDLAKHSHIDDARYEAERTQDLLRRFRTELADVKIKDDINFEIDGFAKFADFFFDGLIADWFMQSKIQNSHESVSNVRSQVQSVLGKLGSLEHQVASNLEKLEMKIKDLIIEA